MKFSKLIAVGAVCLFLTNTAVAQKNHAKEGRADFKNEKYFDAKDKLKVAAEKEKKPAKKAELYYLTAECYRLILQPDQAELFYNKALEAGYPKPELYWNLAEVQKEQANDKAKDKYRLAEKNYTTYFQKSGDKRGQEAANAIKAAQEWMATPTRHIITNETVINTAEYDFSPTFLDRKSEVLIFSSARAGAKGTELDKRTGENYTDLWTTTRDKKGKWAQPVLLPDVINTPDNEGSAVLDSKKETIFFTRCPREKKQSLGCNICMSELKGKNWGEAKVLKLKPEGEKSDSLSIGHPAISKDGKYLVFAGDLPDGQGGKDLWMSTFDSRAKEWGKPVNLGPTINTKGDELFPYISDGGDLYFSSDGLPGMGGLDLFKAKKAGDGKWETPENLKFPMNSPQHDYGLILDGSDDRGFFTSDRTGTKGKDDIWSFVLPPVLLTLTVDVREFNGTADDDGTALAGADVKLIGSDNSSYILQTDDKGIVKFEIVGDKRYINVNTTYTIEVSKKGYFIKKGEKVEEKLVSQISTVGVTKSQDYYKTFKLQKVTEKFVFHMPMILYEFNKADLMVDLTGKAKGNDFKRPINSKDSLNYLYDLMVKFPTWVVQLRSHTDFRGNDAYNEKLSQRRAQACVDYLVKEKGIDPRRIVAKGMGEREPQTLANGTVLTEAYIKSIKTKEEQEYLHILNRRTDFKVLSTDFDPTKPQ